MVIICDNPYNNSDYNEYFTKYDFVLSDGVLCIILICFTFSGDCG